MKSFLLSICFCLPFSLYAQTDSLGIYAILEDTIIKMRPIMCTSPEVKGFFRIKTRAYYPGKTSKYHFKKTAKFRIYLREQSTITVDNLGFVPFQWEDMKRTLVISKSNVRGVKPIKDISNPSNSSTTQISEYVFEKTFTGPDGEYCMLPFILGTAGLGQVFDFTIDSEEFPSEPYQDNR